VRFSIGPDLLAQLRRHRDQQRRQYPEWGEEEDELDAFLLHPGMGPLIYITIDGRILIDERTWNGDAIREAVDDDEAIEYLVIGARVTGLDALFDLLPPPPPAASTCTGCVGTRWVTPFTECPHHTFVCPECHGRGWSVATSRRL
jgi:hypothetical protein